MPLDVGEEMISVIGSTFMGLGAVALFVATLRIGRQERDSKVRKP